MKIDTKYNIGDVIHEANTSPADPEMEIYEDEHFYAGAGRVYVVHTDTRDTGTSICYQVMRLSTNGQNYKHPVIEEDAFPSKADALAEVERRKRDERG